MSAPTSQPPQQTHRPPMRRGVSPHTVTAIAAVTQAMVVLDGTIVNVALPAMRNALSLTPGQLQWVVDGFLITLAGLLLFAARLADASGLKRVFLCGVVLFTAASLVGGLAQDAGLLIAARVVQGIGGAALAPASLSLITATHLDKQARARAISIWAGAAGVAGSLGILLGGGLTSWLDWRWVFFVNVPIGVVLFVTARAKLAPRVRESRRLDLDVTGAVLVTAGLSLLVYGLSRATSHAWSSAGVVGVLAASVVILAGFVWFERRADDPLVPLDFLRRGHIGVANALMTTSGFLITGVLLVLSLYLQQLLAYSAIGTGLALLPVGGAIALGVVAAERLVGSVGPRALSVAGWLALVGGAFWMTSLPTDSRYAAMFLGPLLLFGLGTGLCGVPISQAATEHVSPGEYGLASGLNNTARQIGGAIGAAIVITTAATVSRGSSGSGGSASVVHGFHTALFVCACVAVVSLAVAFFMPTRVDESTEGDQRDA